MMAESRKRILVLPHGQLYTEIMSQRAEAKLRSLGEVIGAGEPQGGGRNVTQEQIHDLLPGVDAVLTTGGAPKFASGWRGAGGDSKIIAHAAGTIKGFILPEVFDKGIAVSHAAAVIAESVGEWALTATLMSLRKGYEFNKQMHEPEMN